MEKQQLDALETKADSNHTSMFAKVVDKIKDHKGIAAGGAAALVAGAIAFTALTAQAAIGDWVKVQGSGYEDYPAGTVAIADASTMDTYDTYPTGTVATSYNSTQYSGRLWTDKTVVVPSKSDGTIGETATFSLVNSELNLDSTGTYTTKGQYSVNKTASGTFLTCISALSSSLQTNTVQPTPLDIVLVLDFSGSMKEHTSYQAVTSAPTSVSSSFPGDGNEADVYYICEEGVYKQVRYTSLDSSSNNERYYLPKDGEGALYTRYYFTTDDNLDGTQHGDANYRYAKLYRRNVGNTKLQELQIAVNQFANTIATNNTTLSNLGYSTDAMTRIAMVKFNGNYLNKNVDWGSASSRPDKYEINYKNPSNLQSRILTSLTTYTTSNSISGTKNVSTFESIVNAQTASGATAAEIGLDLGRAVFAGQATYDGDPQPGARDGVQKVVIFFTDGAPNSYGSFGAPNDFSGTTATNAWAMAQQLKADNTIIYSVAFALGADASNTENNLNIFLNGISSNYNNATATAYTNTGVNRTTTPASNSWSPNLGERTYELTSDTEIDSAKNYYTRTGVGTEADPYQYTRVINPVKENLENYYEASEYYLVAGAGRSIADIFAQIAADITSGDAGDAMETGRDGNTAVTITDYLGDYMEFKGLDGILYGTNSTDTQFYAPGTQGQYHTQAQVQRDDVSLTQSNYTMWASVDSALLNPEQGKEIVNLNGITIQVDRSSDPKTGDTVTITIPPELIPSVRYEVEKRLEKNPETGVISTRYTTVACTEADPLRIFYSVGLKASTLSNVVGQLEEMALRSESATNESNRQTEVYKSFMTDAKTGSGGFYSLYSNAPYTDSTNTTQGKAVVNMTLSEDNSYYFFTEDTDLYIKDGENYIRATAANSENQTLYYKVEYWNVGEGAGDTVQYTYVEYTGSTVGLLTNDGGYYVPDGRPRLENIARNKDTLAGGEGLGNLTGTATDALQSKFAGDINPTSTKYTAKQYLGNNGKLNIPIKGTLSVTKSFVPETGYDLPQDPVPTASYTLTIKDSSGNALTQANTYRALIRNSAGEPVDRFTHQTVANAESAKWYVTNGETFTLQDGETIKITNLPDGATYAVVEDGQQGYTPIVMDNTGESHRGTSGGSASTSTPAANGSGGGN